MNKNMLESVMKANGDTGTILAQFLEIARSTFSAKINETNGAEFTQSEITNIKVRYNLNAEDVDMIFFNPSVSKKDTNKRGRSVNKCNL